MPGSLAHKLPVSHPYGSCNARAEILRGSNARPGFGEAVTLLLPRLTMFVAAAALECSTRPFVCSYGQTQSQ